MEDIVSSPPSPNVKKRPAPGDLHHFPSGKPLNLKGTQFMMPTPPDTDQSSNTSPDVSVSNEDHECAASPASSSSALSSVVEITSSNMDLPSSAITVGSSVGPGPTSGPPPAKRRKLTPSEKLEQQKAREAKDRQKADEKARKEEEKARKDEEKRVKDEDKRKKAEEREAKKREKELKEERKTQEKLDRERKQMRLGAFFQQKPGTPAKPTDSDENQPRARRRSLSLELYDDVADKIKAAASPMKDTHPASAGTPQLSEPKTSDYHRTFLPFELKPHSRMGEVARQCSQAVQDAFDRELKDPSLQEQYDLGIITSYQGHPDIEHYFSKERSMLRGIQYPSMRELVDVIQGTSQQPIDLTTDSTFRTPLDLLQQVPVRYIHFGEDVRPAYCGTYTKFKSPKVFQRFRRNPFTRARKDTNYDEDSEAEWEEPEEGDEEVLSDDEEETDSVADANDDDFLDDEDDNAKTKRKMITGELIAESTGLCWVDASSRIIVVDSVETDEQPQELQDMRMGVLIPGFSGASIDPFSTSYWQDAPVASSTTRTSVLSTADKKAPLGPMAPPRAPLQPRLNSSNSLQQGLIGAAEGKKGPIMSIADNHTAKRGRPPASKILSKEDLEEFKEAVVGSGIGKLELLKGLKARFPKMTNDIIKETLGSQFATIGKGKADKRWVFVGDA